MHLQRKLKFQSRISRKVGYRYLLDLPEDYNPAARKRWPLLLFLHGAGERGTDLKLVAKHGPPKAVTQKKDFPFIIVSPQCPPEQIWDDEALLALLDHIIARFRIDILRVYLTGLSMGGYGTWSLGLKYPERFAAIAPICGGGSGADVLLANLLKANALRSMAVWAFHGARDPVVPMIESKVIVAALRTAGCRKVALTVYPDAEHDSYTRTYQRPEFYQWLLRQQRR